MPALGPSLEREGRLHHSLEHLSRPGLAAPWHPTRADLVTCAACDRRVGVAADGMPFAAVGGRQSIAVAASSLTAAGTAPRFGAAAAALPCVACAAARYSSAGRLAHEVAGVVVVAAVAPHHYHLASSAHLRPAESLDCSACSSRTLMNR